MLFFDPLGVINIIKQTLDDSQGIAALGIVSIQCQPVGKPLQAVKRSTLQLGFQANIVTGCEQADISVTGVFPQFAKRGRAYLASGGVYAA